MICSWWDSERVKNACRGSCKKMGQDAAAAMRKARALKAQALRILI